MRRIIRKIIKWYKKLFRKNPFPKGSLAWAREERIREFFKRRGLKYP